MTAQSLHALDIAQARRLAGVAERRGLRTLPMLEARQRAAELILHPRHAGSMRLGSLLRSIPRSGPESVRLICRFAGVSRDDALEDLTGRERRRVAGAVLLSLPALRALPDPLASVRELGEVMELFEAQTERVVVLQELVRMLRGRG